ncbi:MAG: cysteine-rich CWC family protein [Paludibacteraceae bacterium]|nr:cysteine-rich CWC family protein [Paludibacteraceae bacterium]MBQ9297227.1 cysteine-rich CWC family protein [Paludibacteraceae bacterium]
MVNNPDSQISNSKRCPRCGAAFVCTHDAFCQCVGVVLNENARAYLRAHYSDCLCRNCLEEIAALY